jgi:hypothetical protein
MMMMMHVFSYCRASKGGCGKISSRCMYAAATCVLAWLTKMIVFQTHMDVPFSRSRSLVPYFGLTQGRGRAGVSAPRPIRARFLAAAANHYSTPLHLTTTAPSVPCLTLLLQHLRQSEVGLESAAMTDGAGGKVIMLFGMVDGGIMEGETEE